MIKHCIRTILLPFTLVRTYAQVSTGMLVSRRCYQLSFFRQSWRNKQFAITERIKKCMTSEQIINIININGNQLNIVHLTAILDRIEEESMLNIQQIVDFVVKRLKQQRQYLLDIDGENGRTICNIVCYLGNLKNTELNDIFLSIEYNRLLINRKVIETTMLITGLIRLGIFKQIFGIKHQKSRKQLLLQDIITPEFSRNQILSIWYAYISEISKQNEVLNNYLNGLIGKAVSDVISIKTYTYALVCYVRAAHTLKESTNGPLYSIIANETPLKTKDHLLPYEFSLLLHSINKLKRRKSQLDDKVETKQITFSSGFRDLLVNEFDRICKRQNVTLRNIANSFKEFNECFDCNEPFVQLAIQKINSIITEEINLAKKADKYELDYKIDLLSFASLAWKLGQIYEKIQNMENANESKSLYSKFTSLIIAYVKVLKQKVHINSFTNKELLMLFSGLALMKGKVKLQIDEEFVKTSIDVVTQQQRSYSVKEITLLYTYFKTIKVYNSDLCEYVHSSLLKMKNTDEFSQNSKAKSILQKRCTMNLGSKCFNCFNLHAKSTEPPVMPL